MVRAGAALSLSGRFAVQGEQAQRGLQLWAEDANRQGGLVVTPGGGRRPVDLTIYDDGSTIAGARAATERLIVEDRLDLLFGPYGSVLTIAAAEVAERHGRLLWNHGGSSDALDQRGWRHVVTLLASASRYFVPVLDLAAEAARVTGRRIESVALLHGARGTFASAVIGGARAHAAALGLDVVLDEPYPEAPPPGPRQPTMGPLESAYHGGPSIGLPWGPCIPTAPRPPGPTAVGPGGGTLPLLVHRIANLQPDLVLGVGTTEADLAFAQELRRQQVQPMMAGLVAAPIQHFREVLGDAAEGFCGPSQWESGLPDRPDLGPSSAQFCAAFRERFGLEPDYPAAQAYAAGSIAGHCAEIAGTLDDGVLRQAAGTLNLTTCYGRFRLAPESGRQVGHTLVVAQWQAGRKQVVWPPAVATAPPQLPPPTAAPTSRPPDATPSS